MFKLPKSVVVAIFYSVLASTSSQAAVIADGLLTNGDFEFGDLTAWTTTGTASYSVEPDDPGSTDPAVPDMDASGNPDGKMAKVFGGFTSNNSFDKLSQTVAAEPNKKYQLSASAQHASGDSLVGTGHRVLARMSYLNTDGIEISSNEQVILDGLFATDIWHESGPIESLSPAGTTSVEISIVFNQVDFEGGAAWIDNVVLVQAIPEPTTHMLAIVLMMFSQIFFQCRRVS